jgi:hypothetical protein
MCTGNQRGAGRTVHLDIISMIPRTPRKTADQMSAVHPGSGAGIRPLAYLFARLSG